MTDNERGAPATASTPALIGGRAESSDQATAALVEALRACGPGVVHNILATHVPDHTGHCTICTVGPQIHATWPCMLHDLGLAAKAAAERGLR